MWLCSVQHFQSAILGAWRDQVAAAFINSVHVRERDEALLRSVLVGGVWNGFQLSRLRGQPVPCWFCGGAVENFTIS